MQIRRGPTTHMQPAADCGQQCCSSDPTPPPTSACLRGRSRYCVPTSRSSPPACQSSVNQPVVSHDDPSTTGRTHVAGPDARAWCLDPGSLLDLDLALDLT